jgi:hypothetical protein
MGNLNNSKPLQSGYTRVFVIAGRARPDHKPEYFSSMKMGGISQSFGDITKIEIPDPTQYGKFIEADRIRGQMERATFPLSGRYAAAVRSRMLELARGGCPTDVQLHIGECTDPSAFNTFSKAIIVEDSVITNHSTEDLGSLESGESAVVGETVDVSARDYYEVVPLSFASKGDNIVTLKVNDVTIADSASCGSCASESDGCNRIFAVTIAAGGSPGTPPDVVYSLDGGITWKAHDIDVLLTTEGAESVAGVGDLLVATSNSSNALAYAPISDFVNGYDPSFVKVATGFVAAKAPTYICSVGRKAFITGNGGYIYFTDEPTAGVTVIESGALTTSNLLHIHALDEENAVAVGDAGVVMRTTDTYSWSLTTSPTGVGVSLTSVWMKSKTAWIVTAANGKMYYTLNAGMSWTEKKLPGTAPTKLNRISFATDSVGYVVGIVSAKGRMYRTFDGGYSWVALPEGGGSFPVSSDLVSVVACKNDPNMVVACGNNSTDGTIVLGG